MGGVINIVTRKMQEDGVKTNAQIGYGSYNTLPVSYTHLFIAGIVIMPHRPSAPVASTLDADVVVACLLYTSRCV